MRSPLLILFFSVTLIGCSSSGGEQSASREAVAAGVPQQVATTLAAFKRASKFLSTSLRIQDEYSMLPLRAFHTTSNKRPGRCRSNSISAMPRP